MTTEATQDAPTDASHRPAVAGQVERSVSRQLAGLPQPYYEDEAVTLYHGDALALLPLLPQADAVLTDPPYGETSLDWDVWPDGWPDVAALVAPQVWCFGSMRMFMDKGGQFAGWKLAQDVVWEKQNGSGFDSDRFKRVHEFALHFYRGEWKSLHRDPPKVTYATKSNSRRTASRDAKHRNSVDPHAYEASNDRLQRSVIFAANCNGYAVNETQKPEAIVAPLLQYSVPPGGLVVDCFAGSGTVGTVARKTGRRAILIEKRESQCKAIVQRLAQGDLLTANVAIKRLP
jgi:site-specific DNA-methyltransferase (adenine-specific)